MDVATDTTRRRRLIPPDKNNAPKTKEVSSRYRSPTPTKTSRCPCPSVKRPTLSSTSQSITSKRSLSADKKRPSNTASFQSDSVSVSVSKKERPVDRTLRPSSNIAHKHNSLKRKPTPERKKISPLKAKNLSENSRPVDVTTHSRLIEQHRWPSRSLDLGDKSLRRMSLPLSASSMDRATTLATALARLHPLSAPGVSPARVTCSSSFARPSTPPSRGVSPSRTRQTSTTTSSVLSFITDVKKGKKTGYIEDVHQLRFLHNRYLQWRFAIAQGEAVMYIQRLTSEETLFNVWHAISELQEDVTRQRIGLQQVKLEIKLNSLLNDQMVSLEEWAILEREHVSSLVGVIADLEANTLRLPVTGGTKAEDVESLKKAVMSSALDVMHAMGSSIWTLLSKVEEINKMVSELAVVVTKESCMQGKCEDLLASTAIMQINECSLRTHLIQNRREGE